MKKKITITITLQMTEDPRSFYRGESLGEHLKENLRDEAIMRLRNVGHWLQIKNIRATSKVIPIKE